MLMQQRARLVMARQPLEEKLERLRVRRREKKLQNASPEERKRLEEERAAEAPKEEPKPRAREFKWFGH